MITDSTSTSNHNSDLKRHLLCEKSVEFSSLLPLPPPPTSDPHFKADLSSKRTTTICHGIVKVEDFEKMIPSQWWKTVFADDLYLKTDGDVVEDPEITKEEIKMLESCARIKDTFLSGLRSESNINKGAKILDLCCGQGRHSLFLSEKYPGLQLFGHDQSSYLISLAKERALNLPPTVCRPTFTIGDCRSVPYDANIFDLVMIMGNSFGYFSANDHVEEEISGISLTDANVDGGDRAVLKEINRVLKHGGVVVLDLADGDYIRQNYSARSWEWIDHQTFVCRERTLSKDGKRLHSREVVTSVTRGVVRDQFYSERLYGRAELIELLKEAGFDVECKDSESEAANTVTAAKELSQRGQDLGMMEQRLLINAVKNRQHPKANHLLARTASQEFQHPFLSPENAEAVREWLERLSSETFSKMQSINISESNFSTEYLDLLRVWMRRLRETLVANKFLSDNPEPAFSLPSLSTMPKSDIYPSIYHLLPPPPLPNDQLAVVMGDTSINCREKLNGVWNQEDFETRRKLISALLACGYKASQITILENHHEFVNFLSTQTPAFTLNLCDEGLFNDALKELHVPAMLESCKFPYTGAGPASLAICYDKGLVNSNAKNLGIPTPRECYIIFPDSLDPKDLRLDDIDLMVREKENSGSILYPSFVKPMKGDNSLGITGRSIVHTRTDLTTYIESLVQTYNLKEFIVQEYLTGTEYSVGMVGNPETGFHFLPILQVDYSKIIREGLEPILGWESKWDPESPYWSEIEYTVAPRIPSKNDFLQPGSDKLKFKICSGGLSEQEEMDLKNHCAVLFERFGCRDYARFDWRADREVKWNSETGEALTESKMSASSSLNITSESGSNASSVTLSPVIDELRKDDNSDDNKSQVGSETVTDEISDLQSRRGGSSAGGLSDSGRGSFGSMGSNVAVGDVATSQVNGSPPVMTSTTTQKNVNEFRRIKLLEVNPNPGWCWDGKMAKMAAQENKTYPDIIKSILWASWERIYGSQIRNVQSPAPSEHTAV